MNIVLMNIPVQCLPPASIRFIGEWFGYVSGLWQPQLQTNGIPYGVGQATHRQSSRIARTLRMTALPCPRRNRCQRKSLLSGPAPPPGLPLFTLLGLTWSHWFSRETPDDDRNRQNGTMPLGTACTHNRGREFPELAGGDTREYISRTALKPDDPDFPYWVHANKTATDARDQWSRAGCPDEAAGGQFWHTGRVEGRGEDRFEKRNRSLSLLTMANRLKPKRLLLPRALGRIISAFRVRMHSKTGCFRLARSAMVPCRDSKTSQ